jgi:hypothetical protein
MVGEGLLQRKDDPPVEEDDDLDGPGGGDLDPPDGDIDEDPIVENRNPILGADLTFSDQELIGQAEIEEDMIAVYSAGEDLTFNAELNTLETDKIAGDFGDFYCLQKLYPSGDLPIAEGFGSFVGPFKEETELYSYIDEGVYEGILKDRGNSSLLSDDENSFIQPNTVHTEGLFQYKAELTEFNIKPEHSAFRMRVAAPLKNYESQVPPLYTVYNIRLSDPSGNLIVKYNDIQLKGDSLDTDPNFTTYSSLPETNVSDIYDWNRRFKPHMNMVSGYQISFSIRAVSLDDPFDPGFDEGFEENFILPDIITDEAGNRYLALDGQPLSTQETKFINPTYGFRLSSFEICNSGGFGPSREDYLGMRVPVRDKGIRLERCIKPNFIGLNTFDTTLYPPVSSVWRAGGYQLPSDNDNTTTCGTDELIKILRDKNLKRYIELSEQTGGGIADSGKLVLRFGDCHSDVDEITDGAFNFEFDQSTKNIWWEPSGAFNVQNRNENVDQDSIFYNFESVTLKVLAKKASADDRDFIIDVVGYSNDKLLNVTSPSGGFLQNPSGIALNDTSVHGSYGSVGNYPVVSGFHGNDWPLSAQSLSELDDYFEASGNDHYRLTQYPTVNTTEFQWYEVPLEILDENVRFGQPKDYKMSSNLERIYLDIFPFPSGAALAYAELCVKYTPQSAFNMYSQGGEKFGKAQDGRLEGRLFPSGMSGNDSILNYGSGFKPISHLEELPHLYSGGDTTSLKTNYSRRWRGVEGTVRGPYDIDQFSLAYENPVIDYPFLSGYFKFDKFGPENRYVLSVDMGPSLPSGYGTVSGLHTIAGVPGEPEVYQNIGWRFASGTLFNDHLPGFSGNYTSTDWTALSRGSTTFADNPMYGKIADAFDSVIRISGEAGGQYIDFGDIATASGFAIFVRFTPDSNISGVDYDLFNSGVIVSKFGSVNNAGDGNGMEFSLGYEDGYLCGQAQEEYVGDGGVAPIPYPQPQIIKAKDTVMFSGYQYPLNVLLTYNEHSNQRLKLYTENEFASGDWEVLRATSDQFNQNPLYRKINTSDDVILGYSTGSGVGINMLVSEFGISTGGSGITYGSGTNIVENNADRTYRQVTVDKFFENSRVKYFEPGETYLQDRYKLWDRVNEDTYNEWEIGDFKQPQFGFGFSQLQKRPNTEQIVFHINHHGSGYSQLNTLPLLSEVDSGVAYHTQMENDFLRFHLTDVPNSFYSVNKRITKNIPCGYKFSDRALVVETVLNHDFASGMKWESCEDIPPSGPRMIVSLYTKSKEPYWTADEPNWGLVNRKVHYIKPSSCLIRLDSTFSYDDLCDETESWALFPEEPRLREFKETYFSKDVNDMFVQYDLVYPSGPAFESRLEMHSSHVRMSDVNICSVPLSGALPSGLHLNVSGAFRPETELTLNIGGFPREENGILPLQIQVPFPHGVFDEYEEDNLGNLFQTMPSGFHLSVSGAIIADGSLPLFIPPQSGNAILNLNVAGQIPPISSGDMNLALPKVFGRSDSSQDQDPLTTPGAERGQVIVLIGGEDILIDALATDFTSVTIVDNENDGSGSVSVSGGVLTISGDISNSKLNALDIQSQINNIKGFRAEGASSAGDGSATAGSSNAQVVGNPNPNNLNGINLTLLNTEVSFPVSGDPYLSLSLFAPQTEGLTGVLAQLNTLLFNNFDQLPSDDSPIVASGDVTLTLLGGSKTGRNKSSASMPLIIKPLDKLEENLNLYVHNPEIEALDSGVMNLYTASYNVGSKGFGSAYGLWDGVEYGTGIELEDNYLASILVSNEIRGVDLTAFGTCTGDSPSKAIDDALITDCTVWREETCNEGGAFRAKDTYTNPTATNFEGGIGYSGNYYGIRKYTQLLPAVGYDAVMTIKTGNTKPIPVPREFEEWEYGMCGPDWYTHIAPGTDNSGCCNEVCQQNIVFSGIKLVGDDSGISIDGIEYDPESLIASGRQAHARFGSAVSVKDDLMAVSAPDLTIPDFDPNRGIEDYYAEGSPAIDPGQVDVSGAGSVFLYRRGEDVPGQKANWTFEHQIMLPTGFRKDYVQRSVQNVLRFDNLTISGVKWQLGQEGRRFGESLDMCNSGDRQTLIIGAPRAKWERDFVDIPTSGIDCATLMVADLFSYDKKKLQGVAGAAQRFNVLWKYFTPPWNPGADEWYPQVNTKVIVLQLTYADKEYKDVPKDEASWFQHKYIPRLDDLDLLLEVGGGLVGSDASVSDKIEAAQPVIFDTQFSGVVECLDALFPVRQNVIYSGLPPIMGMFKEQTGSTAGALRYTDVTTNTVRSLYDRIEDYYVNWTYSSGVQDFVQEIKQSGHLNTIVGKSEDVYLTTRQLISDTFDSGRLSRTFTNETLNRDFIASGVGQEWGDTHTQIRNSFQIPPASGGRVYIFEKERDEFNCIQVIVSPDDISDLSDEPEDLMSEMYSFTPNDRFGHSVGISANSEVVTIGSPWKTTPVRIYERDDSANQRVYDNIRKYCESGGLTDAVIHYDTILSQSGESIAKVSTYDHIGSSERFRFRNEVNYWGPNLPQPYKLSFGYNYSSINYVGTNKWLASEFAPTSRLGWSTAVSEDGNIAAFGAPTDSFNLFEDVNVWGTGLERWNSFQHGGAVRIFESRKYYPHDKIVEFGRFGNLDMNSHPEEKRQGLYDQWDQIFGENSDGTSNYKAKPFRRMDFSEISIPTDAGLCFITTPELDSASDEIIENIKDWLALGDRNLVLVGNDPVWEENGLYKKSNDVINKVLNKLDSRMRIFAAKDESYAMQGTPSGICVSQEDINNDLFNITSVPAPSYTTGPTVSYGNFYGKGFGDIRIDLSQDNLEDYKEYFGCPEGICCDGCEDDGPPVINDKCEFPLAHHGDLRARWLEQCIKTTPRGCKVITYVKNWPFQFGNFTPPCDDPPVPMFRKQGNEPVPVLTTMEHVPPSSWYRPATSGLFCTYTPIYKWIKKTRGSTTYEFADHNVDYVEFNIQEDENSNVEGILNSWNVSGPDFIDPDVKNNRDGLVQGIGRSYYPEDEERKETKVVYPISILALVESGRFDSGDHNNSQVYVIGSQWSEDDNSRGIDSPTLNDDKNTEFYINMVRKNCDDAPRGIQINGFTGHESLSSAYYTGAANENDHGLADKLNFEFSKNNNGGYFLENKTLDDLRDTVDFAWIAQPLSKASESDVEKIKTWLNRGNKKLVVTYNGVDPNSRQDIAENVDHLVSGVNLTSRPFFIPSRGEYWDTDQIITGYDRLEGSTQFVDTSTDPVSGCDFGYGFAQDGYNFATSMSGVEFSPATTPKDPVGLDNEVTMKVFVPLSGGQDYEKIIWFPDDITETFTIYPTNRYKIDGEAVVDFPVVKNSGYRMFINWVSETDTEEFNICGFTEGGSDDPDPDGGFDGIFGDSEVCGSPIDLERTTRRVPQQTIIDFRATETSFKVKLNTDVWANGIPRDKIKEGVLPTTPRFLSISGCPLEIISETVITTTSGKKIVGYNEECEWIVNPAQSGEIPGFSRPVQHLSNPYCIPGGWAEDKCENANFGQEYIQDGPVIVAEEPEQFSSFPAGRRKSHIIVVSDSTIIQGLCPQYRGSDAIEGNQKFIRSLYPPSPEDYDKPQDDGDFFPDGLGGSQSGPEELSFDNTRNWYFAQKIRAPEVGSPGKYNAVSGQSVQDMIFEKLYGGGGAGLESYDLSEFYDNEDYALNPTVTAGRPDEVRDPIEIAVRKEQFNDNVLDDYGMWPRFSGDFLDIIADNPVSPEFYNELLGEEPPIDRDQKGTIADAQIRGGMSDLMKATNTDYLDFDVYNSGCAGDLFGYSIDLSQGRLIVGTPFNGFYNPSGISGVTPWHYMQDNVSNKENMIVAEDGGAGAAFIFDRTTSGENLIAERLAWEFTQKIRPSSLNVGIYDFRPTAAEALTAVRGPHQISDPTVIISGAKQSDRFGLAVSIDCDMCVIGAPNHDFQTIHQHIYSGGGLEDPNNIDPNGLNTAFTRKNFTGAFDIPLHKFFDLGDSGTRVDRFENTSGVMVLNAGAVYNYRNKLVDFQKREQSWVFAQKLVAQSGYKGREQGNWSIKSPAPGAPIIHKTSGNEFDNYGKSVSIHRAGRGDSDYTTVIGAPNHIWPVSGDHFSKDLRDAGAAFTYDAMLREQPEAIPNSGGWIDAHVFGTKKDRGDNDRVATRVYQNETGPVEEYKVSGLVFTNSVGDIFLEVSGFDPAEKGFIGHRPYIDNIKFTLRPAVEVNELLNLNISGRPTPRSGDMNLALLGADMANVYNNLGMYNFGVSGIVYADAIDQSGLFLNITAPSGPVASSLNLSLTSTQSTGSLPLRMRGF